MATQAIITFGRAGGRSVEGSSMPMLKLDGSEVTEVLTVTSATRKTNSAAPATGDSCVSITARGGDVYVVTGADPVAVIPPADGAPGKGHPVLAGQTQGFSLPAGAKVAVIALPAA